MYAWEKVRHFSKVILVEGLFDYAVMRQAGLHNVTCSLGTHLNVEQLHQLREGPRASINLREKTPPLPVRNGLANCPLHLQ